MLTNPAICGRGSYYCSRFEAPAKPQDRSWICQCQRKTPRVVQPLEKGKPHFQRPNDTKEIHGETREHDYDKSLQWTSFRDAYYGDSARHRRNRHDRRLADWTGTCKRTNLGREFASILLEQPVADVGSDNWEEGAGRET